MENCREYWIDMLIKIADPVLLNFSRGTLHRELKIEATDSKRECYKGLEILGRTLAGIAPWIEVPALNKKEERLRLQYAEMSRRAIAAAVNPESTDYCFVGGTEKEWNCQYLVDASYLAFAIVRAPRELGEKLPIDVKNNLIKEFIKTRNYRPVFNNWLLFTAMVEAALYVLGQDYDLVRIDYAIRQTEQWYMGDGIYGDGPKFQMDYYNSFSIQPMMACLVRMFHDKYTERNAINPKTESIGETMYRLVMRRFSRYAKIQEESIAPDGSYPPYGRSLVYRCGAFQVLAQAALWKVLPMGVSPAIARGALTRVIAKTLGAPDTFTKDGWLQMGVCGHQPKMGTNYTTTASLYMATLAFLPLGLPQDDEFWSAPDEMGTWEKCFSGVDMRGDLSLTSDEKLF